MTDPTPTTSRRTFSSGVLAFAFFPVRPALALLPAAQTDDAALSALCREYLRLWGQELPLIALMRSADDAAADAAYATCEGLWDAKDRLIERIIPIRARTDLGAWLKAQVTFNALNHKDHMAPVGQRAERTLEERLALSLCRDMGA